MAKEKRSAADLDAELAALEAELAALEAKPKKAKTKPAPARAPVAPAPELPVESAEPREKKGRFAIPKLGKKEKAAPSPEPKPEPSSSPAPSPSPSAPRPSPAERFDASLWRQEEDAWVRVVPDTPVPVVRRVLDESGNLLREEPASVRDVEEASGVKAERGLGRLLRRK